MSTFHEIKLGSLEVTCFAWKPVKPAYLAVGTTTGVVKFYWSDGIACDFPNLLYQSRTSSAKRVTSLVFHPFHDLLVALWSDGVMRSWHNIHGTVSSQMSPHSVQLSSQLLVSFDQTGIRLISADYVCYLARFCPFYFDYFSICASVSNCFIICKIFCFFVFYIKTFLKYQKNSQKLTKNISAV